jgi:plasmid stabilization system protein ParE
LKRYRVELSPEALGRTFHELEQLPHLGAPYPRAEIEGMRRILLSQSRYHVYYTVVEETDTVRVHAIWHTARVEPLV